MGEKYAYIIIGIIIGVIITIFFYSPYISDINKEISLKNSQIEDLKNNNNSSEEDLQSSNSRLEELEREYEYDEELINLLQEQLLNNGIEPVEL